MKLRFWLALFSTFIIYTYFVYNYCDERSLITSTPSKQALAGWQLWQQYNCQSCHQIYGLGGYLGPDLTNVSSDTIKNEQYLRVFTKYGTGKMPDFHLNDTEVMNIIAFLGWVDKSGRSKVPKDNVTSFGNYNFKN